MAGAVDGFRRLAERAGVPVMPTWLAMDLIEDDHPLYGGPTGRHRSSAGPISRCRTAIFLIVLGSRLDMALTAYKPTPTLPLCKKSGGGHRSGRDRQVADADRGFGNR
ncbi:hypothetical protein [Ectopseudomonas mendocina]|uniref:hypothetical protein n=1 Tax=Ectopseudomonas mendocina TaxID=300 RepID=UPI00373FD23A